MNIRTDLALEVHEFLTESAEELSGILIDQKTEQNIEISKVKIETKEAAKTMGKPMGNYITLEFKNLDISAGTDYENLCHALSDALSSLLHLKKGALTLVVGLGNQNVTPDALGPAVVEGLIVTRHLFTYMPEQMDDSLSPVCAVAPGVLGMTGMETEEIIRGIVKSVKPDCLIAVDALAARSIHRILSTIQICDTGIAPGAGVGNNRKALNQETLGIPVIALGVPTVVDAPTITADALQAAGLSDDAENSRAHLRTLLPDALNNFVVTPKEIDIIGARVAKILANGINFSLHKNITFEDISAFIS